MMSDSKGLVIWTPETLGYYERLADMFAKSGMFKDASTAARAIVKMKTGAEMGFPEMVSMRGVYVDERGNVSVSSALQAAAIKRDPRYDYRVVTLTDEECVIDFFENGEPVGTSTLTMAQAKAAHMHQTWDRSSGAWKDKVTWKNFPRNMLFARTLTNGYKWYTPDASGGTGAYIHDELGVETDEAGDYINGDVVPIKDVTPGPPQLKAPEEEQEPEETKFIQQLAGKEVRQLYAYAKKKGMSKDELLAALKIEDIKEWVTGLDAALAEINEWLYLRENDPDSDLAAELDAQAAAEEEPVNHATRSLGWDHDGDLMDALITAHGHAKPKIVNRLNNMVDEKVITLGAPTSEIVRLYAERTAEKDGE